MTTTRPRPSWARTPLSTGARVTLCRDRAMTTACASLIGRLADLEVDLAPGVWFWRLQSTRAATVSPALGPVWQFRVPRVAPVAAAPVSTSWGASLDLNGDGRDDIAVSAVEAANVFVYQSPVLASGAPTQTLVGAGVAATRATSSTATAGGAHGRRRGFVRLPRRPGGVAHRSVRVLVGAERRRLRVQPPPRAT
ncbi:MAG: FG-GAP repeat protein [Polyangiales bacterium]